MTFQWSHHSCYLCLSHRLRCAYRLYVRGVYRSASIIRRGTESLEFDTMVGVFILTTCLGIWKSGFWSAGRWVMIIRPYGSPSWDYPNRGRIPILVCRWQQANRDQFKYSNRIRKLWGIHINTSTWLFLPWWYCISYPENGTVCQEKITAYFSNKGLGSHRWIRDCVNEFLPNTDPMYFDRIVKICSGLLHACQYSEHDIPRRIRSR